MRNAIGRQFTSFLADGLTTTAHQADSRSSTALSGDMCSPNHATPVHKETFHVAVHSR